MSIQPIKILFLASNPSNETRLRLGAEATKIKEALEASSARERFIFSEEHAVRLDSIQRIILKQSPTIVHFSGHGSNAGALVFEDHQGRGVEADSIGVAELFRLAGENTRLIVLNACYSERQAKGLAQYVDSVIGMDRAIADETAIGFAKSLYETLGERRNVKTAFELAKNYVRLQRLPGAELYEPGASFSSLLRVAQRYFCGSASDSQPSIDLLARGMQKRRCGKYGENIGRIAT